MNYSVPDFGQDHEIMDSLSNEKISSKMVGHNWEFKTPQSAHKWHNHATNVDYNFAPNLDSDVVSTISHQKAAEGRLGQWDFVQN